ncbi:MAG: hypothetical protein OSA52_08840 [Yoonia sp.]|nr:hypothetical protein [Yoonia sp.]
MEDVFEERFVVFIDILGFGSMVSSASREPNGAIAKRVDTALTIIENMRLLGADPVDTRQTIGGFRSHIFSDYIVMSVDLDSFTVSKLFVQLAKLTVTLMGEGVWIRGGMSKGLISRRQSTPWGPAIVEAYRVESELAKNPRLALSKSALDFVRNQMDQKQEDGLILRDSDGVWSLSPMTWALRSSYGQPPMLTEYLAMRIKRHLEEAHQQTVDNPGVFQKIDWLCDHWNKHVWLEQNRPDFDCRTSTRKRSGLYDAFGEEIEPRN